MKENTKFERIRKCKECTYSNFFLIPHAGSTRHFFLVYHEDQKPRKMANIVEREREREAVRECSYVFFLQFFFDAFHSMTE